MEHTKSLKIVIVHDTNKSTSEYEYDNAFLAMKKLHEFLNDDEWEAFMMWSEMNSAD